MGRRGLIASLIGIIAIAAIALGATLVAGRSPLLGLDLRGGVEVVLQPQGKVTPKILTQAVDIIDRRVDGLGVANSSVARQGNDVVIELPGIKNSQSALQTVGATAQLYFRPVECVIPAYASPATAKTPSTKSTGSAKAGTKADVTGATGDEAVLTASTTTKAKSSTTTNPAPTAADCTNGDAASLKTTNPDDDNPYKYVVLPSSSANPLQSGYRYLLGPSSGQAGMKAPLSGTIVKSASAAIDTTSGADVVNVTLTGKGLTEFNKVAAIRNASYSASDSSSGEPYAALEAIELDGVVESAPAIEDSTFSGPVQITGNFTSRQATDLATELSYGSLPVRFNPQQVQTISASLGSASLKAGLLAGVGGIVLVLLYMLIYYRALGLVVVLGLGVGGALLYAILTELSYTSSLALTLEGVTGIIVSIGITVDSYVVYFERLKDEVRSGKTVRSSVERGFTRAFKTVLTADLVSFMAALILYLFSIGDVRGFAFTLGLSTLLDVFTAYFFIRPIVVLLGRRRGSSEGRLFGIGRGLGAVPAGGTS